MSLRIETISLADAKAFVADVHRHHKPPTGHKFSVCCVDADGVRRGVAIVGRPVSRHLDDGKSLEVLRVATDGTPNACSILYGAARRAAKELGYRRILTYTLPSEGGASLRGAGWVCVGEAGGGSWNRPGRHREDDAPTCIKHRWEVAL